MSARTEIAGLLWWSVPSNDTDDAKARTEQMLDAYRAEVLAEAADVAEMVGSGFFDNAHSGEGNGAMAVAAELRERAGVLTPTVPTGGGSVPPGPIERVTVYLTPASSAALIRAAETVGDSKTDTINRAIQTYALMADQVADGGRVLLHPGPDTAYQGTRGEPGEGQ